MTDNKQVKVAVDVIVKRDGKILMGKRLNAVGAGTYGVPGGHLELGEQIVPAAKRELEEETGLKANDLELISVVNTPGPDHYIHFLFQCVEFEGEPQNTEPDKCEGWEWFEVDRLPENIFEPHKAFVPAMLSKEILFEQ